MKISLKQAKTHLRSGEVIAVPTETVFGLAVDATHEEALLRLYNLKGRVQTKPFVIQVSCAKEVIPFLTHVPYDFQKLTDHYWPGALTLVLPVKEKKVSNLLRSNLPTAAFRVTAHAETRALLSSYGPLAITSANRSGSKDLISEKQIEDEFGEDFPILRSVVDELPGTPSTILAYTDASWVVLRIGGLSIFDLAKVLGYFPAVVSDFNGEDQTYNLRVQLHLMHKPYDGSIKVVLGFKEREYKLAEHVVELGSLEDPKSIKRNLAQTLKELHQLSHPHVWVDMNFPKEGEFRGVVETLKRAGYPSA